MIHFADSVFFVFPESDYYVHSYLFNFTRLLCTVFIRYIRRRRRFCGLNK